MSLQVITAPGALVALGIGIGDVASIIYLGRRLGNWWTRPSGDVELLKLLDEDEYKILKSRGLLDILAFNKRWRKQIRLFGNSVTLNLKEEDIQAVLKDTDKLLECRLAWSQGIEAAAAVAIGVRKPPFQGSVSLGASFMDIEYAIVDRGQTVGRAPTERMLLAERFGLVLNQELLDGLIKCLQRMTKDQVVWLGEATEGHARSIVGGFGIADPEMKDEAKIINFSIFQSFFMGYYYDIFSRLVDTSTLVVQTVEGCWGFRSEDFFRYIMSLKNSLPPEENDSRRMILPRRQMLPILERLFLDNDKGHENRYSDDPEK
ncbi:hypothetical protein NW762_003938 [Fusarium torreyae]|uniref:Uncharacterized protein n=1 Tax=Fusarium torreyae TaxID=1237075 RepID=A0A9W8S814_9HYPO|nr:hypothetical protein NW762_003938 [Fusarium torreyae]